MDPRLLCSPIRSSNPLPSGNEGLLQTRGWACGRGPRTGMAKVLAPTTGSGSFLPQADSSNRPGEMVRGQARGADSTSLCPQAGVADGHAAEERVADCGWQRPGPGGREPACWASPLLQLHHEGTSETLRVSEQSPGQLLLPLPVQALSILPCRASGQERGPGRECKCHHGEGEILEVLGDPLGLGRGQQSVTKARAGGPS